mgnify:CR=1 FL=1
MNAKKNSRFDLERRRFVLFQVGLLTAGSFTLAAFNYTTTIEIEHEKNEVAFEPVNYLLEENLKEPDKAVMIIKKPEVDHQEQSSDQNNSVASENSASTDNTSKTITSEIGIPDFNLPEFGDVVIHVTGEGIDSFPIKEAQFIGGYIPMRDYIVDKLDFTHSDRSMGINGKVFLSFVVEKDGSITNVQVERGVSESVDREVKRVIRSFPKWEPGENAWGKVRTVVRLPINVLFE